jgi:hypothetical protein
MLVSIIATPCIGLAYPEGAPWGASDPDAAENCESCHFDYAPVRASDALTVDGLPEKATAGERYDLVVRFNEPDAVIAGFQMIARDAGDEAGEFVSTQPNVEYVGAAIRSTEPLPASGAVEWLMTWTAPDSPGATVTVFVAAMRANDDGSPFGDQAHFRRFVVEL